MRLADAIDSLDREQLADAIDHAAQEEGRLPELLVQVNIGDEPQKSGVPMARGRWLHPRHARALRGEAARADVHPAGEGVDPRPISSAWPPWPMRMG